MGSCRGERLRWLSYILQGTILLRVGAPQALCSPEPTCWTLEGSGFAAFQMKGWPLSPERDPSALDLQTWKALAGQAQIRQTGIYFGNTVSWKSILGPYRWLQEASSPAEEGGLPREGAQEGQAMQ